MNKQIVVGSAIASLLLGTALYSYYKKSLKNKNNKETLVTVSALYYYPVKSCGYLSATELSIDRLGFVNDRRYLVVAADTNKFVTQRQYSKMALIKPTFDENNNLVLNAVGMPTLVVKPNPSQDTVEKVTVWDDNFDAIILSDPAIGKWLSEFIGTNCKLATTLPTAEHQRAVDDKFDTVNDGQLTHVAFSDGFPFLLVSEESLTDLNSNLQNPVEVLNFRPNIVVKGVSKGFEEDTWKEIQIGSKTFQVVKSCSRCSMPTINQHTGVRDKNIEPLKTLRSYRLVGEQAMFGQNLICVEKSGVIRVGDVIKVISTDDHHSKILS